MKNKDYVDISLSIKKYCDKTFDLCIPNYLTLKDIMLILNQSYQLNLEIVNPFGRIVQSGQMIASTQSLYDVDGAKNGIMIEVEEL